MIRDNISVILGKITDICRRLGRDPGQVTIVAVTKFAEVEMINEALKSGLTHIGENKVQQAQKKFPLIESSGELTRHMIGHLQSNKVKSALEYFDLIQSVDSLKLANTIEKEAAKSGKKARVLVQVNTAGEEQKFGCPPPDAQALVGHIRSLEHVQLEGLMTIAPMTDNDSIVRKCFKDLKNIYDRLGGQQSMRYLSMGMTDDYEIALEEGSNMVRIGRAIFSDK